MRVVKKEVLFWGFLVSVLVLRIVINQQKFEDGQKIRINDIVLSEPIYYDKTQGVRLHGFSLYLPKFPEVGYRDRIVVTGIVNGKTLKDANLLSLKQNDSLLIGVRNNIITFIRRNLPEPHASLVAGVTLGSKSSVPQKFWESLRQTSTTHVVVASGMNVSLVAGFMLSTFLVFTTKRRAAILALIGIWTYAFVAGFDAPIVRAAIMGSMIFISQVLGKTNIAVKSLFLASLVMLCAKPIWLSDLGFWLSFVATASLMLFGKKVDRVCRYIPGILREGLSTSIAAQIGVTPILYYTFGYTNILSPLINALILWTVPIITIIGMVASILGLIYEPLGRLVLLATYPLANWFIFIVRLFGGKS